MKAFTLVGLFWLVIVILGAGGWIANVCKIIAGDNTTVLFIARCIGVIAAPLGAVLGFV